MVLMLDIGCGERKIPGALGIDIRKTKGIDVVSDAKNLPFRDEVFDVIYSSMLIEHISHMLVDKMIKEWVRTLKKGGTIEIRCPDLRVRCLLFFLHPTWQSMVNIFGMQDHEGNYHKCGFTFGLLKGLLEQNGISNIRRIRTHRWKGVIPVGIWVKGTKLRRP
jgi:predicted SAM-dependent methyltransferase